MFLHHFPTFLIKQTLNVILQHTIITFSFLFWIEVYCVTKGDYMVLRYIIATRLSSLLCIPTARTIDQRKQWIQLTRSYAKYTSYNLNSNKSPNFTTNYESHFKFQLHCHENFSLIAKVPHEFKLHLRQSQNPFGGRKYM